MSRRLALFLIIPVFLWGCARRPLLTALELPSPPSPCYRALVKYRLSAGGRARRGKAVVLARGGCLYAEGFSPLGGVIFSVWWEENALTWFSPLEGRGGCLRLVPEGRLLSRLWPFILMGHLPPNWPLLKDRAVDLGEGYWLVGASPGFEILFRGRKFLHVQPLSGGGARISLDSFRIFLEFSVLRFDSTCEEIPPRPRFPERRIDLNRYFSVSGD